MITRVKSSSVAQGLPKYRSMLAGNDAYIPVAMESIATVTVGSGGSTSVSFSSIPSTYAHLQLRYITADTVSDDFSLYIGFNSNGSTDMRWHRLLGDGSTVSANGYGPQEAIIGTFRANVATNQAFGAAVVDILDYASANKNRVTRSLFGGDKNGVGYAGFVSGAWFSTTAISSIQITTNGTKIQQNSHFALYGIKSA